MKQFKAFIPFLTNPAARRWARQHVDTFNDEDYTGPLAAYLHDDPVGASWRNAGIASVNGSNELAVNLNGAAILMCVQFNERMLPGKVRDEKVAERVAVLQDQTGRKVGKKEYAQIRDEVELELLPKAFIKRSTIPVMFMKGGYLLIFSSSAKRATDTISILLQAMPSGVKMANVNTVESVPKVLTELAVEGSTYFDDGGGNQSSLDCGNAAVLRGEEKAVMRIKDHEIEASDVQALLDEGYDVHELALNFRSDADGDTDLTFVLNDKLCFKRVQIPDVRRAAEMGEEKDADFVAGAWLVATIYGQAMATVFQALGGHGAAPEDDEDDEL